ncbi:hypothetical protein FACS1894105_11510 [Clostridia bacterium]|nr:hypothetical protein FACS1894105_11510 [Clostridia bacterium]
MLGLDYSGNFIVFKALRQLEQEYADNDIVNKYISEKQLSFGAFSGKIGLIAGYKIARNLKKECEDIAARG